MPVPDFIEPELATLVDKAPEGLGWLHEIKFDGYRVAGRVAGGKATLLTRRGLDWTNRFPLIADDLERLLKDRDAYIDGEIVSLTKSGISDFGGLQESLSRQGTGRGELVYYAFDLLWLGGLDLRSQPLRERKIMLLKLLGKAKSGRVRLSQHVEGNGPDFFRVACKTRLEGIVSKKIESPYRSGRFEDWLKAKCTKRQEFVVGGWLQSDKQGRTLASLLLGYYDAGKLNYAGKVGTGFGIEQGKQLVARLTAHARQRSALVNVPRAEARKARWAEPRLVVEVEFTEWTSDGHIRRPSFKGVRDDKLAREVRREQPEKIA